MSDFVNSFVYLVIAVFLGFIFAIVIGLYMDAVSDAYDENFVVTSPKFEGAMIATKDIINISYWIPYTFVGSGILFVVVTVLHKLLYTRRDEYEEY